MKIKRIHHPTLTSTNTWAKDNASQFDPRFITLITTSEQTAGRGRFDHRWFSPKHSNLYASFCFFVDSTFSYMGQLAIFFSLITCFALESIQFRAKIKWPNDLLLSEKKVGGILCETSITENKYCIIAGIGLNINMPEEELRNIDRPATSLSIESGKNYALDSVVKALENALLLNIDRFLEEGLVPFFDEYNSRLNLQKGQKFTFNETNNKITGHFHHLNSDGSITLLLANGSFRNFYS